MFRNLLTFITIYIFCQCTLAINSGAGPIETGTKKALIIAISEYPESSGWKSINCYADVKYLKKALNVSGFDEENIQLVQDSVATKSGIKSAIIQLTESANKNDIIFIHFSGHGQQILDDNGDESDEYDEAWVPYGAPAYFSESYRGEEHFRDDELWNDTIINTYIR